MARPCVESISSILAESHVELLYGAYAQFVVSVCAVAIKCNRRDSIRQLLDESDVTSALITLDALGCQSQVLDQILQLGGKPTSSKEHSTDFRLRA